MNKRGLLIYGHSMLGKFNLFLFTARRLGSNDKNRWW